MMMPIQTSYLGMESIGKFLSTPKVIYTGYGITPPVDTSDLFNQWSIPGDQDIVSIDTGHRNMLGHMAYKRRGRL